MRRGQGNIEETPSMEEADPLAMIGGNNFFCPVELEADAGTEEPDALLRDSSPMPTRRVSCGRRLRRGTLIGLSCLVILVCGAISLPLLINFHFEHGDDFFETVPTATENASPTTDVHALVAGLDPSEALGVEDGGGVFRRYEDGSVAPALQIVQELGYQWVRIRIMVEPDGKYGLFQDLSYVMRMARQVKLTYGMKLLLDFHYSHWWADGENQWSPERWRSSNNGPTEDMAMLRRNVFDYTKRIMQVLQDENAFPDAVQLGNEISSGMLWDQGKLPKKWHVGVQVAGDQPDPTFLPIEWHNLKDIIQSGIDAIAAVVEASGLDQRPKIMVHLDTGGSREFTETWMRAYFSLSGKCDIIGLSWYPMWHGTFQDLKANIDNLSIMFPQQEVWLVETAYYYEGYCEKDDAECHETHPYPMTEEGQYNFLRTLRETLLTTKCKAVFYWGSHWSQPKKWFVSSNGEDWADAERRALFDRSGRALKGIQALVGR